MWTVRFELPTGRRAGEVVLDEPERPGRPEPEGGVGEEEVERVVGLVLGVQQAGEQGVAGRIADPGHGALHYDRLVRVVRADGGPRVPAEVAGLAGAMARAEPQRTTVPDAPDRHHVRLPVRRDGGHP